MKIYAVIVAMILVPMFGFASCGEPDNMTPKGNWEMDIVPDSTVRKVLGDTVANLLFNAKKVSVYSLANREPDKDKREVEVCPYFVRDSLVAALSMENYSILKFILLSDTTNYQNDPDRVKSPYRPLLEFEFSIKKEKASVLISYSDYTWAVMYKGKEICRFNYAYRQQMYRLKESILKR